MESINYDGTSELESASRDLQELMLPPLWRSLWKSRLFQRWCEVLPVGLALYDSEKGNIFPANDLFARLTEVTGPEKDRQVLLDESIRSQIKSIAALGLQMESFAHSSDNGDILYPYQAWHVAHCHNEFYVVMVEPRRLDHLQESPGGIPTGVESTGSAKSIVTELQRKIRTLEEINRSTQEASCLLESTFDAIANGIALITSDGAIVRTNEAWKKFLVNSLGNEDIPEGGYLRIMEALLDEDAKAETSAGIRCVLNGSLGEYRSTFSVANGTERRWFQVSLSRLAALSPKTFLAVHTDVSNRYKSEQDLRESHSLFRHVVEGTTDGIFMYDLQGRFVMTNSANAETLGLAISQIVGRDIGDIFKPEIARIVQEQNLLVLTTGQTLCFELDLDTPRGPRTMLVSKGVYRNHRNEAVGIFGIARDITDRKRVEETLKKSERHFRALIENSADRVGLLGEDGTILYASPSTTRILGFADHELLGTNAFLWVHPDDLDAVSRWYRTLLEEPGATSMAEYRNLCKDGQWRWMEATATNLLRDPSVHAIVINERDVTERKSAESQLRRFEAIIESSYDAIISSELDGCITSWNSTATRIFGYSEREAIGKSFAMLVPHERVREYEQVRAAVLRGAIAQGFETVRMGKDGKRIDVSLTVSDIRDRDGKLIGFSNIIRDITEKKRMEREILEISDREKQRLGQDLHDDLCQHLVGISLIANLLAEDLASLGLKQADQAKQVTEMIRKAVDHARSLARGLSPVNLAESGFMAGLESLVVNTERLFRVPCSFECSAPVFMKNASVATHLYRIAQEALHNAVKHSQASRVVLSLQANDSEIVIAVKDNGIGMPERDANETKTAGQGGLGMHTMHYRARMIGATLEFLRNPEGGTSVVCTLPNSKKAKSK